MAKPQPRLIFFSYGSGPWRASMENLCDSAIKYGIFDEVLRFCEEDLQLDQDFWTKHQAWIQANRRGGGYWLWKSYLTQKILNSLNENDILIYMDAGCYLWPGPQARNRLNEYLQIVRADPVGFYGFSTEYPNCQYTKEDTFLHFNATQEDKQKPQIMSGATIWRATEQSRKIATEWYNTMANNYNLIDDSPSKAPNNPDFKENRHDQSILTMLIHKYNAVYAPTDELWDFRRNNYERPFWAARLRDGADLSAWYYDILRSQEAADREFKE
jgi:hypothetical protein